MNKMVQSEFSKIDRRLSFGLVIYGVINLIACAYFVSGLDALFNQQVTSILLLILLGSIFLGPPVAFLIVFTITVVCLFADYAGPNSAISSLMIVGSLCVSFMNIMACPYM